MKNKIVNLIGSNSEHLITTFGRAKLVTLPDGSIVLQGGQAQDRTAAKEWISLFMHEVVPYFSK